MTTLGQEDLTGRRIWAFSYSGLSWTRDRYVKNSANIKETVLSDEYISLLDKFEVPYDERVIWARLTMCRPTGLSKSLFFTICRYA
jgi:hypothetical protein